MNTGQVMLTIGAMVLLSLTLTSFYGVMGNVGQNIIDAQAGISMMTVATSFLDLAQNLAFDSVTDTSSIARQAGPGVLTGSLDLGPEPNEFPYRTILDSLNDFDDFNGLTFDKEMPDGSIYSAGFRVNYVVPTDINTISSTQTFVKRMDATVKRIFPPPTGKSGIDSLRVSQIMGYF